MSRTHMSSPAFVLNFYIPSFVCGWNLGSTVRRLDLLSSHPTTVFKPDLEQRFVVEFVEKVLQSFLDLHNLIVLDLTCSLDFNVRKRLNASFVDVYLDNKLDIALTDYINITANYQKIQSLEATYVAVDCENLILPTYLYHFRTFKYAILKRIGVPRVPLVIFEISNPFDTSAVDIATAPLTYPNVRIVFNGTNEPSLWTVFDLGDRRLSTKLNQIFVVGRLSWRKTSLSNLLLNLRHQPALSHLNVVSANEYDYPSFVAEIRDPITGRRLQVEIICEEIRRNSSYTANGVLWKPLVAFARTPNVGVIWSLTREIFRIEFWVLLISSALSIAVLLRLSTNRESGRIALSIQLFRLIACFLTPIQCSRERGSLKLICLVGLWALSMQFVTTSFKGNVVATLQNLPEERIKSVAMCDETYGSSADGIFENKGIVGVGELGGFLLNNAHYFLQGGVLCLESELASAFRRKLFRDIPNHDVRIEIKQYAMTLIRTVYVRVFLNPNESFHHSGYPIKPDYPFFREKNFAQQLQAHAIVRKRSRLFENFERRLEDFFSLPLSNTYGHEYCDVFSANISSIAPQAISVRCLKHSDLHRRDGMSILFRDMKAASTLLLVGLALASCIFFLDRFHLHL